MENNTEFLEETQASEAVGRLMQDYVRYSNLEFLPNNIDGLKLLYRRILCVLNEQNGLTKCTTLVGLTMKLHPHGDNGIEQGVKTLGQPFNQVHPWLTIKGNFGAYGGAQSAAGRYLDVEQNNFARDIFFNGIDKRTLTYIPCEVGHGVEPAYLIPKLPTALLMNIDALSCGFKTNIPCLNFVDVCDLVLKYIELRNKYPMNYRTKYDEIAKFCLPDFPSHSVIRNSKYLYNEYSKGNFDAKMISDGVLEMYPNEIHLRSIPHGKTSFEDVIRSLGMKLNSANMVSANCTEVNDLTTGIEYGDLAIKLKRGVNPFEILSDLKKLMSFTQNESPQWIFVDKDGRVCNLNPMNLLEVWYLARHRSILAGLKFINNDLFKQYRKLLALIIINDHTDEVIKIFKNAESREKTIEPLCKRFGLTAEQAEYISSLQLHQITRKGKDELLQSLNDVKNKINELQKKFTQIDNIIVEDVNNLKTTYSKECQRRTVISKYIGALHMIDLNGYIQFSSYTELHKLLRHWSNSGKYEILIYPQGSYKLLCYDKNGIQTDDDLDFPKEFFAYDLRVLKLTPKYTILLKSGEISRNDGISYLKEKSGINAYVGKEFTAITNKFKVVMCSSTDIPKRQTADARGQRSDIIYVNGVNSDDVVVAFVNSNIQNSVDLVRLKVGSKYNAQLLGKTKILGMWKFGDAISFDVPGEYLNRCSSHYVLIHNVQAFFKNTNFVTLQLSKKKTEDGRMLYPLFKGSDIVSDSTIRNNENV